MNNYNITNKSLKRISIELIQLYELYNNVQLIKNDRFHEIIVTINNDTIRLICSNDYPFKIPNIYINNLTYKSYISIRSIRFINILKKLYGTDCLCCHSYLCMDKWAPTTTLIKIINEILSYKKLIKKIIIYELCRQIENKFNITYIHLFDYLYA
jgi:ubiquitin-protein ligase